MKRIVATSDFDVKSFLLSKLNGSFEDYEFVFYSEFEEMILNLENQYPDMVVIGKEKPDENILTYLKKVKNIFPDIPIVITASGGMSNYILQALLVGACAFYSLDESENQSLNFAEMLKEILGNKAEMNKELARILCERICENNNRNDLFGRFLFTGREKKVLKYLNDNKSLKNISESLKSTEDEIKITIRNIFRKIHNFSMLYGI